MYKLINNIYGQLDAINKTNEDGIMLSIPVNPDNTDYQEYLKFLAEGGTPLPAENE